MRSVLALCLILASTLPVAGEEKPRPAGEPFLGLAALDPFRPDDRDPGRLQAFADMGLAFARTVPIRWGRLEPQPPRSGPPRYAWKALDEAVLVWQLAGLRPVLVLTPESSWGSQPRQNAEWTRKLKEALTPAEAQAALRSSTACTPPRDGRWKAWQRFVHDVVERYDGDGKGDMPGLRRPVRHVQILERLRPDAWFGGAEDYMRVLHHAGLGAKSAAKETRLITAAVDLQATGSDPYPDRREWDYRIGQLVPRDATLAKLEVARRFALIRRLLEMPRLYDVVAQTGSAHTADDVANLRFLRRYLDEHGGSDTALWLVDNPTRKLGKARATGVVAPKADEARLRSRWLPVARNRLHSKHAMALAWLRRGQAFDLVRGASRARAAGADVVLFLAPGDTLPKGHPRREEAALQGFVVRASEDAPTERWKRTPSWWAFRQMERLLASHRSAGETSIGAPGRSVVYRLDSKKMRPWIAVLMLDERLSWAGAPGEALPVRDVLVPLPSGHYMLESLQVAREAPRRRRIEVKDGMVRLSLSPAPLYVIPTDGPGK